jgi:hypothetical protein
MLQSRTSEAISFGLQVKSARNPALIAAVEDACLMMKRSLNGIACALLLAAAWPLAAQEAPDATIELTAGSYDAGVGYRWNAGTLRYRGASYPLRISGLTATGVDVPVAAAGAVYHLSTLDDFDGFYSETELPPDGALENDRGVLIRLHPALLGERLQPSPLGVEISLEREGR